MSRHRAQGSVSLVLLSVAAVFLLSACGGGGNDATPTTSVTPAAVASVALTLSAATLQAPQTLQSSVTLRDAAGNTLSGRSVTYTSSNTASASVSSSGLITAVTAGSVTISATSEGRTGSAALTIVAPPAPVASVSLSLPASSLVLGGKTQAVATTRDVAGNVLTGRTVAYTTSTTSIATVSTSGLVTGLAVGTSAITATSEGVAGTAIVTVTVGDLSALLDSLRSTFALPGLGAVIVTRAGVQAIGVTGQRRMGGTVPITLNDIWSIGSDTKAFTSILLGRSIDAGVIGWDKPLTQVLPDLVSIMRTEYKTATVANVANHAGGFVNNNTAPALSITADAKAGRDAWVQWSVAQAPIGAVGGYYYSNNGYGILGGIIERAWGGGATYESLMASKVYQPLGITDATWGPAPNTNPTDGPIGHQWNGTAFAVCEGCSNPPATSASGRVHISLRSWARVIQELMLADAGQSTFLTPATARRLTTGVVSTGAGAGFYAMGWIAVGGPSATPRNVTHDGSNNYNYARAFVFLDAGVAYLMVTNAADPAGTHATAPLDALMPRLNAFWLATGH